APYDEVAGCAVDPTAFDVFDAATRARPGFPYGPIRSDAPRSWVWGWSLTCGAPRLVPAARVFAPFTPLTPDDHVDGPVVSGFATDNTLTEATLSGLLEVIDRDAF